MCYWNKEGAIQMEVMEAPSKGIKLEAWEC